MGMEPVTPTDYEKVGLKAVPLRTYVGRPQNYICKDRDFAAFLVYFKVECLDVIPVFYGTCFFVFDDGQGVCDGHYQDYVMNRAKVAPQDFASAQRQIRKMTGMAFEGSPYNKKEIKTKHA